MANPKRKRCSECGYYLNKRNFKVGKCASCQFIIDGIPTKVPNPEPYNGKGKYMGSVPFEEAVQYYIKKNNVCRETAEMMAGKKVRSISTVYGNASEPKGLITNMMNELGEYQT